MNESEIGRKCSRCGAALPGDAPEGLCPRCLMALNLAAPTEEAGPGGTRIIPAPPEPPLVSEIARLFPQFEIIELLGRGGMGFVYKARQPRLDRFVALKILAPDPENRGRFAERFEREAQALAKLTHPNIVAVFDFGESGGYYFLVMEFVDGVNLRQLIASRKLNPQEALTIVPHICDALHYAHSRGIVHRDIKPENILLDSQGRVKIADFGIAKLVGERRQEALTAEQQTIGTPHYMAPEQIEKPTEVDHRADIYSLGVVFYELLTGELPLGKFAPPSKKVQVDVRLDDVVLHALEKEPERRYQQANQVKTDVENIAIGLAGGPAAAPIAPMVAPVCATSDKTILPAFLLAFFFGVFGAHRFYVGKTGTALAQLFTFGGCGIWATIDWILLLCKAFTDREGRRLTEWIDADAAIKPRPQPLPGAATGVGTPIAATSTMSSKIVPAAIGLIVAAGLKLMSAVFGAAMLVGLNPLLRQIQDLTGIHMVTVKHTHMGLVGFALSVAPSILVLLGGLKMLRAESYHWAMAAAILCIVFPPLHLVGIPIGIWALVVLRQQDVRTTFNHPAPAAPQASGNAAKAVGATALVLLALLLPAMLVFEPLNAAPEVREQFDRSVQVTADPIIHIDNVNGKIEIHSRPAAGTNKDAAEIVIKAVKRGRDQEALDRVNIDVDASPSRVSVHTRHATRFFSRGDAVKVDYVVEVPERATLRKIETVNGQVVISGVRGDIAASSVNGSVETKDASGNLSLSTVNGKVTAEMAHLGEGQTVSFSAVNGTIGAVLPRSASAKVSAETVNGTITTDTADLPVSKKTVSGRHVKGTLGDGAARLTATTVNGSIRLRTAARAIELEAK